MSKSKKSGLLKKTENKTKRTKKPVRDGRPAITTGISTNTLFGHAAYVLSSLSIPRKELVGFSFRLNNSDESTDLIIGQVYFDPADYSLSEVAVEGTNQTIHAFQGVGADDQFDIIETGQLNFNNFEFLLGQGLNFVFFSKDELEPLIKMSDKLIVSGCQIQFGKAVYDPPPSMDDSSYNPNKLYFTLKVEVDLNSDNQLRGREANFPSTIMTVGQPCPPRWVPTSLIASILGTGTITPEQLKQNASSIRDTWYAVADAPPPVPGQTGNDGRQD